MSLTLASVGDSILKHNAERSLRNYLKMVAWPVIEPETPFRPGWHIDAMCDHTQAVVEGTIRNLLVTVPPRHTKSIIVSVAMPTWAWVRHGALRFLFASFSGELSMEHAVLSRRILDSDLWMKNWGHRFRQTVQSGKPSILQTDQNVKTHYENTRRGYRISTSVGGTVVGRGGDILTMDDPHNLKTIESAVERLSVLTFYQNVWANRFNDPKTGRRILIMQRGHEDDLAGHIIEQGGWTHLNLPTEYEPTPWVEMRGTKAILRGTVASEAERQALTVTTVANAPPDLEIEDRIEVSPLAWKDPRTVPGELLNPDRFGPTEVAQIKRDMGPLGYATQHQQRPMPMAGGMFKREKLRVIRADELPKGLTFAECRGWDQAATEVAPGKDPDYTCGGKLRRYSNGRYVVMHMVRGRYGPDEGDEVLLNTSRADGKACRVREEQEGGASGKKVTSSHSRLLAGYDYLGQPKNVNKSVYAKPFSVRVDAGDVVLLEGAWNQEFIDELCLFANGRHDDQVDAISTAFHELADNPVSTLTAGEVLLIGSDEKRSDLPRMQF